MASLDIQRLWKLHKVDSGLVDIRNQAAALDPGRLARAQIEQLKAQDAEIGGHYRTLNQELLDLELLQKGADDKIKRVEKELYSGSIVNARESEAHQKEIDNIKKHKDERDERLLELYELIPPAKAAADKILQQMELKRQELGDANKKAQVMKLELEREFARLTKLRPEAAKIVNPTLLAKYESIRQRHNGIGMAEVTKKGSCSGCGTSQPERALQALREDKSSDMRIVPPNPVSHRGRHLNRKLPGRSLVVFGLLFTGCAKFPATGASQFTKITFNVTMAGPINPQYIYYVAMFASTDSSPLPLSSTPIPVVSSGSINGWLTGEATNYVLMTPSNLGQPFGVWSVGAPTDPGSAPDTLVGYTNDQLSIDSQGNYPSTWSFSVYTSQLTGGNATLAQQLQSITYQIIVENKPATGSLSGRIMDAIGPGTNFIAPRPILLNSSNTQTNSLLGNLEVSNDTVGGYDPALDITDFSVTVSKP